jgi:hypothetical protein
MLARDRRMLFFSASAALTAANLSASLKKIKGQLSDREINFL